ncbi:hypothetical protein N431DRAFT_460871 [Stipitochalara longipes BDJ]|nr:hypothetical protein N431DRAFT_460871 [Stipitochalara longipes BDJ]
MVQILNLGLAAMTLFSFVLAAPGSEERSRSTCSYFIQTDYDVTTEYNVVFATVTTTAYVPVTTVFTTSSTETRTRTHKKDDTVVLTSTCI